MSLVQHLLSSLSQALDIFYPLAGHLAVTGNEDNSTTCVFVDCNNTGVEFFHAAADCVRVADLLDSVYVPDDILFRLFPMNGVWNFEGISILGFYCNSPPLIQTCCTLIQLLFTLQSGTLP
ncbi:hypothetical protein ACLB2K_003697 [Fragaria x ananassa]